MNANAKSYVRTLSNGSESLTIIGIAAKTGFGFYILHQRVDPTTKKKVTIARGASAKYATLAETVTAVDAAVVSAVAAGWKKAAGPAGGFKPKADGFSLEALPKPAGAPVEAPKEEAPKEEAPAPEKPAKVKK